ncbi:MAG: hypothetical protein FWG70_04360 [Oscillospiraceae bacterium]|nr:hypothetical protein [Oscillospiraceae bacterium]
MTALIITGAIISVIIILMSLPIVFEIDYHKEAEIKIRLLFFDLFKEKEPKPRKLKKKKKKPYTPPPKSDTLLKPEAPLKPDAPPEHSEPAESEKTVKTTLKPKKKKKFETDIPDLDINLIKILIGGLAHPIKKLIKKIKITELYIESIVGGSDAAQAALNFGTQNAAIYSALAWLKTVSSVKVGQINIRPDFMREDSVFNFHCKVKIRLGTVALCAIAVVFKFMKLKTSLNATPPRRSGGVGKTIRIVMD